MLNSMKRHLFIIFLLFSSCSKDVVKNQALLSDLPSWYVSPKQNNSNSLYGIGEGFTLEESTKSALADAATRLFVSISSSSSLLREENNYDANEETRQLITQNIEKIDFANFEVSRSVKYGQKIYTEVKIDREQFINLQKEKLLFIQNQISDLQNLEKSQNIVKRRVSLIKIHDLAKESEILTRIIYANGDELRQNLSLIAKTKNEIEKISDQVEFFIISDNKKFANLLKNSLNKRAVAVNSYDRKTSNQVILKISSEKFSSKIYGAFIVKIKINFDNYLQGKIIASNEIEVSGSSTIDELRAFDAATENLKEKIASDGVFEVLGLI